MAGMDSKNDSRPHPLTPDMYHECLDRVHVASEHIGHFICDHPAITGHPEHVAMVEDVMVRMAELYQAIGEKMSEAMEVEAWANDLAAIDADAND